MSVTHIDQPDVKTAWYSFDEQEEAVLFIAGVKDELAENEYFDFVDSDLHTNEDGQWIGKVHYVDRTPDDPEPVAA